MTNARADTRTFPLAAAAIWLTAGLVVIALAWMIPVNLKSVTPALLRAAGEGTPSVAEFGQQRLESEKFGAAQLVLDAARLVNDPAAPALDRAIASIAARRPDWVPWGGWDPFLDPLFNLKENTGRVESTPVLAFFITEKARRSLQVFLSNSRSLGVQSILQTRENEGVTRFVPATRAGGEALDAVILLTALLYQSENLGAPLQRELRTLAERAAATRRLDQLETFYIDLLSLGKRLDWMQLCELMRATDSVKTVGEYAQLTRVASDNLPLIYTAALYSGSADKVADYLMQYGKQGLADLRLALGGGQGAVQLLLRNAAPVNHNAGPSLGALAEFALFNPRLALAAKYAMFFIGAFCLFRALEIFFSRLAPVSAGGSGNARVSRAGLGVPPKPSRTGSPRPEASGGTPDAARETRALPGSRTDALPPLHMRSALLAAMIAFFLVIASEPFLTKTPPPSEFKFKLFMPVLAVDQPGAPVKTVPVTITMDTATILTISIFAVIQLTVYMICLLKIRSVARQPMTPQLKLRLMDNEENLFDGGLYVGIAGTATALVLQVLGVIHANLLAAYSSNLFGILCVALIKIRHVRNFKRQLILESQGMMNTQTPAQPDTKAAAF